MLRNFVSSVGVCFGLVVASVLVNGLAVGGAMARKAGIAAPNDRGVAEQSVRLADTLFIMPSGDGGWWGDIEAQTGKALAARGHAVIGLDTNKWFQEPRTPDAVAAWLGDIIRDYGAKTRAKHIIVAGWSFGANILPIAVNRLPEDVRARITAVVALAPEQQARLVVTLAGRMGIVDGDIDLGPEIARLLTQLPPGRFFCVDGAGETENSACQLAAAQPAVRVTWPGGHSFDHNADVVTNALLGLVQDLIK